MSHDCHLIFYEREHHARIVEWLAANPSAGGYCLPLEDDLGFLDFEPRFKTVRIWEYIGVQDLASIDRLGLEIAHNWYRRDGSDPSRLRLLSLGQLIEHPVMLFAVNRIKPLVLLPKLVRALEINRLVVFGGDSVWERAAQIIAGPENLCITRLTGDKSAKPPSVAKPSKVVRQPFWNRHRMYSWACAIQARIHSALCRFESEQPEVAVVASGRTVPVIRRILQRSDFRMRILAEGALGDLASLAFRNASRLGLVFVPPSTKAQISDEELRGPLAALDNAIAAAGLPGLTELVREDSRPWLRNQMLQAARWEASAFEYLRSITARLLIVLQDFQGAQRALALAARTKGIRCLTQQHGAIGFYPYFVAPVCDYVSVWSRKWSKWFTDDLGVEPERIRVISEPLYEKHVVSSGSRPDSTWRLKQGIPPDPALVLYAFQPNPPISAFSHPAAGELAAMDACAELGRLERVWTILKMHPSWPAEVARQIVSCSKAANVTVLVETNNFELLQNVDVVVTRTSTLAFEAALLGVPVVALDSPPPGSIRERNPFLTGDFALVASTAQEAAALTRRLISDPEFRSAVCRRQQENLPTYLDRNADLIDWLRDTLGPQATAKLSLLGRSNHESLVKQELT